MTDIVVLEKDIIFKFVDDVTLNGFFKNSVLSDTIITGLSSASEQGKDENGWGTVEHVGPDVEHVSVGDTVIIETGMWTSQFIIDDTQYWRTDESKILAISEKDA